MKENWDKCFHCKGEVGQVYVSDGKMLCEDCFENLRDEKLPPKKAKLLNKNYKNGRTRKRI